MKVGIFTFHYAYNYGAVSQCMALYRTLQRMGVDVDVVNYLPSAFVKYEQSLLRGWGVKKGMLFKNIPKKIIQARYGKAMRRAFDEFREKNLTFSSLCSSPTEIAEAVPDYDALITGSDQVWNFAREAPFFLEWGTPCGGKRISYAPCCGRVEQPQEMVPSIKKWLDQFDAISVRNDFSKKLIEGLIGRTVSVVADPTLLVDLNDVQKKVELPCSDYILMYTLGEEISGGHKKAIELIRKKVGNIPVVAVIPSAHKPHLAPWADHVIYTAGPAEWLSLIANAKFVYTDSFHGAIFALKNNRPFIVYYAEEWRSLRMTDLAKRYRLAGSVAHDVASLKTCLSADAFGNHEESFRLIDQHVAESMEYLRSALGL